MRRVIVIGPHPACAALTGARFAQLLSARLEMDAFAFEPAEGLVPARSSGNPSSLSMAGGPAGEGGLDLGALRADTVVWLRFPPRAYLRDWFAGWLDVLLNGAQGARRRGSRASLGDFARACLMLLQPPRVDARQIEALRAQLLVVELHSPDQARFWLHMQEERVRETLPPRD